MKIGLAMTLKKEGSIFKPEHFFSEWIIISFY